MARSRHLITEICLRSAYSVPEVRNTLSPIPMPNRVIHFVHFAFVCVYSLSIQLNFSHFF